MEDGENKHLGVAVWVATPTYSINMKGNTMAKDKETLRIVRLTTGEELLCKANPAPDGAGWYIRDAVLIVPVNIQNISFVPWMMYADAPEEGIHLPEKIIAFTVEPQKRLKAEYDKMFSKILTPDSNDIMSGADMAALGSKLRLAKE